jgi:hypothetical protein
MNQDEVKWLVVLAVERLKEKDGHLLEFDVSERALTHRLANYLEELFGEEWHVDVEYNRHFDDPKKLNLRPRTTFDDDTTARTVFPDIVIHKRGTDDSNLLVLEIKKVDRGEDFDYDADKLRAFRKELGYIHTAHVILRPGERDPVRFVT